MHCSCCCRPCGPLICCSYVNQMTHLHLQWLLLVTWGHTRAHSYSGVIAGVSLSCY
jgi:hypothetical protein